VYTLEQKIAADIPNAEAGPCDNGTVRYWSVLLGTVQYRCRRLGVHRAHLYRIWRPKPNQTGLVRTRTAQYVSVQRGTGVSASPRTVLIYMEYGCARRTEAKSDRNRTKTYYVVPMSPPRLVPYPSERNMAAAAKSDWNCTDTYCTVPLSAARYRCPHLAAHRTYLYGIWLPKPNQTVIVRTCTAQYRSVQRGTGGVS
jgi:hypothetical protein